MMKWKWRIFWVTGLILLWLLCSGTAQAGVLADHLAQFPNWQGKPPVQSAQGDLAYPDWFAGNWTVTTTLVDLVAPLAPEVVTPGFESNRQFLNQPVTFKVRFVEAQVGKAASVAPSVWMQKVPGQKGWGQEDQDKRQKQIVSDRAFNGTNLAKAYLGDRAILAVKVDPADPNRQITLLRGDRQLVSTVTDRATESAANEQFITTEIFQQEFRGGPQIYFNQVENTTAYTRRSPQNAAEPVITADQVTAIYLSPQDSDYFKTTSKDSFWGQPRPVALYRYRMEFFPA